MKVGDLVKLKNGTAGIIMKIVDRNGAERHPWAMLHCGELFSLRDLEVISESRR